MRGYRIYLIQKIGGFDLRLLVIDDNEEITEAIHFFCESKKDIECYMINDGQQGLERSKERNLILLC